MKLLEVSTINMVGKIIDSIDFNVFLTICNQPICIFTK
jgi:hypothetical protein